MSLSKLTYWLTPMTKESDIQRVCHEYLTYMSKTYNFRHFHVPNEGKRNVYYNTKLKNMGLKSGCPDIIVEYPKGRLLYIELKTAKGRLSENQKLWKVQSKIYETPHYIVKGDLNDCIEQVKDIIERNIPKKTSQLN